MSQDLFHSHADEFEDILGEADDDEILEHDNEVLRSLEKEILLEEMGLDPEEIESIEEW